MEYKRTQASIRMEAKREISEGLHEAKNETEIKVIDRENLCTALNNKYSKIKRELLLTFYYLGVGNKRDGRRVHFEEIYSWHELESDYDYSHMSEEELLEILSLHTDPNYVINVNRAIEFYRYKWWDF